MSEPTPDLPADDDSPPDLPNPETGVGIGASEPSTFEPEEDDPSNDPD